MHKLPHLLLLVALLLPVTLSAQRTLGEVRIDVDKNTIPVRVSANTPELNTLALLAFNSHGRYRVVASGHAFDLRFSGMSPNQVRVDVTRGQGGAAVASQIVNGTTARDALLQAADIAVEKTNGLGLRGFFTTRLAFVGEATGRKEVYISDLFFSPGEVKAVTRDRAHVLTPRWSPDGTRLLYTSYFKSGFPDIFHYDLRSYQRTTFVSFRGTNQGARFSPDGRNVVMVLSGTGAPEVYVSNASGGNVIRRTRSDFVKSSPCWSPDGTQIVFAMEPGPQLHVMPASGGQPRRLPVGFTYSAEPDWSRANPNRIACTLRVGRQYQIGVFDFATGKGEVVSKASFDGVEPAWLADGRHLVYSARDRTTSVLCILDTETGKSTPISGGFGGPALQASTWAR
jgi:TolB protein